MNVSERMGRIELSALLGPLADLLAYFAAVGMGASVGGSQAISFVAASALIYLPQLRAPARANARIFESSLCIHLMVVTLLAFLLRIGVFALLSSLSWPAPAVIASTAIATAVFIRPGYQYCIAYSTWRLGSGAGWRVGAAGVIAFALLARVIYSGQVELLPEETYYWNYSRHLDIGYLDHPPMVSWLVSGGVAAFGDTELGVRIGALGCGVIAAIFSWRLTRNLFGEASGLVAVLLMQTLPFFFLSGMLMTPDAPLTAAWAAALYYIERSMIAGRGGAWWLAGACLGLGLLSKYTIALLGVSTLMFMVLDPRSRRWLRRPEPYGAALLALAIFSPVLVWNAHNGWASFAFQTTRRLADHPRFSLHKLIGSAVVLLTPTGFAAAAVLLAGRAPEANRTEESVDRRRGWRFLQLATLVPLSVFAVFSLRHEVKLDWTGAPLVAAVPALAFGITQSGERLATGVRGWLTRAWVPTIIVLLLTYGAGLYYLACGIPGLGYSKHAELLPVGWRQFGAEIHRIARDTENNDGREPLIIGMDRYAIASELAFYSPDRAKSVREASSAHLFGQVGLMYERWFPLRTLRGRTLLLVAWDRAALDDDPVRSSVERLDPIEEGVLRRNGQVIRPYYYRVAYGYRGFAAPE